MISRQLRIVLLASLMFSGTLSAEVNFYVESVVSDPAEYKKQIGEWIATDDAVRLGYRLSLMAVLANGENPATHVVVLQVPDYSGIDRFLEVTENSKDWRKFHASLAPIRDRHTEGHAFELATYGAGQWEDGEVIAAIALSINDQADYQEAFAELQESVPGKKRPGMVRLMRTLEGGAVSHYVLVSGPSFATVNSYLDTIRASSEYAVFQDKVSTGRKLVGIRFIKVINVWESSQ